MSVMRLSGGPIHRGLWRADTYDGKISSCGFRLTEVSENVITKKPFSWSRPLDNVKDPRVEADLERCKMPFFSPMR